MVTNVSGNYSVNPYAYTNAAGATTYSTNSNPATSYLAQPGQDTVSFSGAYQGTEEKKKGKTGKTLLIIGGLALAATTIAAAIYGKRVNGEGAKLIQNIKTGFKTIFTKEGRAQYAGITKNLPGVYENGLGKKIIIDNYGTVIKELENDLVQVEHGGVQKIYNTAKAVGLLPGPVAS